MKHQLTNITWREVSWQRPYQLETVWELLTHLAATTPRGAVIWEARGNNGRVTHLLSADVEYINKVEEVFRAHGDMQFREVTPDLRQSVTLARTLKISHPMLSLNINIASAVIRTGLAALAADKTGRELVLQLVLGRGYAPSPTPAELPDPAASWLNLVFGTVSKATTEARRTVREKAEQHSFQAVIRIGVSGEGGSSHLHSLLSALRTLESAGVRICDEAEKPERLNCAHVPWHFPLQVYTSFQQDGKNTGWVLGKTLPPITALRDPATLLAQSMTIYGTSAEEIEAEYLRAIANPFVTNTNPAGDTSGTPIGRRKR